MTDYRCPSCDGGFPDHALDDGCPWCGEAMDGSKPSGVELSAPIPTAGAGRCGVNAPPPGRITEPLSESGETPPRNLRERIEPRVRVDE